jgi:hypothetical protein
MKTVTSDEKGRAVQHQVSHLETLEFDWLKSEMDIDAKRDMAKRGHDIVLLHVTSNGGISTCRHILMRSTRNELSGKPGSKPGVSIQGFPRISIKS